VVMADACDMIVSEIINRFFDYEKADLSFAEIARQLGFTTLEEQGADDIDQDAAQRELFWTACEQEDYNDVHFRGKGWKVWRNGHLSPLAEAVREALEEADPGARPRVVNGNLVPARKSSREFLYEKRGFRPRNLRRLSTFIFIQDGHRREGGERASR